MLGKLLNRFGYVPKGTGRRSSSGFPAASNSRLLEDWPTTNLSIDSILRKDIWRLRPRARHLAMRAPLCKKYLSLLTSNVLGKNGLVLKNKAQDPPRLVKGKIEAPLDLLANRQVEDSWNEWGKPENCTVEKNLSWREVQALSLKTTGTDGEVLAYKVRGKAADNPFNFALRIFECDLLDLERNADLPNGNKIRMGVEKTQMGKRVAYHLFKSNPSDTYYPTSLDNRYVRVPAEDVVHLFIADRPQQTRGCPWLAVAMLQMQMLNGFSEAELIRKRGQSNKHGFFEVTGDVQYEGPKDGEGVRMMDSEPGTWEELPAGLKPVPINWGDTGTDYDPFVKRAIADIASGLLVSYPTLANDYASVNFSSGRMSQLEEREVWSILQGWFADHFCTPIFSDWLGMALGGEKLPLPASRFSKFNQPNWHGRGFTWVDPAAEVDSAIREINAGLSSPTRKLAAMGLDRDELYEEIAADKKAAADLGIEFSEIFLPQPTDPLEIAAAKSKQAKAREARALESRA